MSVFTCTGLFHTWLWPWSVDLKLWRKLCKYPPTHTHKHTHTHVLVCTHRVFVEAIQFLKGSTDCEGIFRKSGSVIRQKNLRVTFQILSRFISTLQFNNSPFHPPSLCLSPLLLLSTCFLFSFPSSLGHPGVWWLSQRLQRSRCGQSAEAVFTGAPPPSPHSPSHPRLWSLPRAPPPGRRPV